MPGGNGVLFKKAFYNVAKGRFKAEQDITNIIFNNFIKKFYTAKR